MSKWQPLLLTFIIGLFCINNPAAARFMSTDPVSAQAHIQQGNIQGVNRYAYANNNPYRFTDPDGRNPVAGAAIGCGMTGPACPAGAVVGGVIGATLGVVGFIAYNEISESGDSSSSGSEQSNKDKKGKKSSEIGECPDCEGETTNKEGKIAKQHGMTVKEVKEKIHGGSKGSLPDNPDLEVCKDCGGMFPQTESGELGDVIDYIDDKD